MIKHIPYLTRYIFALGLIVLIGASYTSNANASLRADIYKFRECRYQPVNCECCKKVDIIFRIYNKTISELDKKRERLQYFIGNSYSFGTENRFIVLLKHTSLHSTGGFKTVIIEKLNNQWRETFSIHTIGIIYENIYGGICFQTHRGAEVYTHIKQSYTLKAIHADKRCGGVEVENREFYFPRYSK